MPIARNTAACSILVVAALASGATAQSDPETLDELRWRPLAQLELRTERVSLITGKTFDRRRGFFRGGGVWSPHPQLEIGGALEITSSSYPVKIANDNEQREGVRLDQAFARWLPNAAAELTIGKSELPLWLTPLVWDEDLRPIGLSYSTERAVRDFDRVELVAGAFDPDHRFDDDSRLIAVQAAWRVREGAVRSGELLAGYLRFDDLEGLVASGLVRTNRHDGVRPLSEYKLIDLQGAGRIGAGSGLLEARVDLVENLGARDQNRAARASLSWSQEGDPGLIEIGASAQRIQRDAVPAAFNSDDWWFHSDMRGVSAWIRFRLRHNLSLNAAAFSERLDAHDSNTERLLLDFEYEF